MRIKVLGVTTRHDASGTSGAPARRRIDAGERERRET